MIDSDKDVDEEFPLIARARALRAARLKGERERAERRRDDCREQAEGKKSPAGRKSQGRAQAKLNQCKVVIPGTMASPSPRKTRIALSERRLNKQGSGGEYPRSDSDGASSDATQIAARETSQRADECPTLVRAKFNDVCVQMAKIGREVNELILRGCYLSQQTMMDAEANHRSAFRIAAELPAQSNQIPEPQDNSSESERSMLFEDRVPKAPVSPVYRLAPYAYENPTQLDQNSSNSHSLIARGFSLSRFSQAKDIEKEQENRSESRVGHCAQGQKRSQTFIERTSKRGLETVRRIFFCWRRQTWVRICFAQRLGVPAGIGPLDSAHMASAHNRLGTKLPFDAAAVFARDGKHRMAREWRENRIKRVCLAKFMMNLIHDNGI